MGKKTQNRRQDCFPEIDSTVKLPRPIPLCEIKEVIGDAHQSILGTLNTIFSDTSKVGLLVKNRGRLMTLVSRITESLETSNGERKAEDLTTFGDLRRTQKKVHEIVVEAKRGHPKFKDRRINPELASIIDNTIAKISSQYCAEIRKLGNLSQPASTDDKQLHRTKTTHHPKKMNVEPLALPLKSNDINFFSVINQGIELNDLEFPQPLHGYLDMDALALERGKVVSEESLPSWMLQLRETEANRLSILLADGEEKPHLESKLDTFFLSTNANYFLNLAARSKIIQTIMRSVGNAKALLNAYLKRHAHEGSPEESGVYIRKQGFLRTQEQLQLMQPNLTRIVEHHFGRLGVPAAKRTLIDIGTWDGKMPKALSRSFGDMIGIEPNDEHFTQLLGNPIRNLQPVNADMQTILSNPAMYNFHADMILFSHVLYFLQKDEADTDALSWALHHLNENGILVIILNDAQLEPSSRAHIRKHFGVREGSAVPHYYQKYFEEKGINVRMMRPTLYAKAHTDKGRVAMRDLIRFILPGETRHDHAKLKAYQNLIAENNGVFKHTLHFLVAYKNGDTAPAQPDARNILFRSKGKKPVALPQTNLPKTVPHHHDEEEEVSTSALEPLTDKSILAIEPAEILRYVQSITQQSWGEERKTRALLQGLNIPWNTFRSWIDREKDYEAAVKILNDVAENGHVGADTAVRQSDAAWKITFASIRRALMQEIESGNSSFGPDEIDVALEWQLQQYKLWTRYCSMQNSTDEVSNMPEEEHPSMIGFTKEEVILIPREDREHINGLFRQLSKESYSLENIEKDDVLKLREIARRLLLHKDTLYEQFSERLGVSSEVLAWQLIRKHQLSLLNQEETAALRSLGEELLVLQQLKDSSREEFEDRKSNMKARMALYRRLIRMEHAPNAEQRLRYAQNILEAEEGDFEQWERKKYSGFSNYDLAPDLFPSQAGESDDVAADLDYFKAASQTGQKRGPRVDTPAADATSTSAFPMFAIVAMGLFTKNDLSEGKKQPPKNS